MTGKDLGLVLLGLSLFVVSIVVAVATKDIPPCWPNC